MNIFAYIQAKWNASGGYSEFLKLAFPLIISTGAWSIQNFINRFFLAWYSTNAFAAAQPAATLNFAIMSIFIGTLSYVDVFVSQYYGNKEYKHIGPAVWQSVHLSFVGAVILFVISLFSQNIFNFIGHAPEVIVEEVKFFRILCYGALFVLTSYAFSGFYSGRSKTRIVLYINAIGILINIFLDYLLIFGNFGLPRLGIEGAAIASIIASFAMCAIFLFLIIQKKYASKYSTRTLTPDFSIMRRLIKFGFPNGLQFFFDVGSFTFFILVIGTLGTIELSATNIALNIYHMVFMPVIGCGIATSILVGQYLGRNKASIAQKSVRTAVELICVYVAIVVLLDIFVPNIFIYPFSKGAESALIGQIRPVAVNLIRFIALFALFDPLSIIFQSAIKGAGDTAFVMKVLVSAAVVLLIIPIYLVVIKFHMGIYAGWGVITFYIAVLAVAFFLRYKSNKWKKMRVIEMNVIDG